MDIISQIDLPFPFIGTVNAAVCGTACSVLGKGNAVNPDLTDIPVKVSQAEINGHNFSFPVKDCNHGNRLAS